MYRSAPIISVIGTPGAGKSTLLETIMQSNPSAYVVAHEPVADWEDSGILKAFYNHPTRYALAFQTIAVATVAATLNRACTDAGDERIVISERDLQSSHFIFAQPLMEHYMNAWERETYQALFDAAAASTPPATHYIWLDVSPEVCLKRIVNRNRPSERKLTLAQLTSMDTRIGAWAALPHIAERLITITEQQLSKITATIDAIITNLLGTE